MNRIYLSGPMTGLPKNNYPAFFAAEKIVGRKFPDATILNPARNLDGNRSYPREVYLRLDLLGLAKCDGIVMLEGWEKSYGARMELLIACELEIKRWCLWSPDPDHEVMSLWPCPHIAEVCLRDSPVDPKDYIPGGGMGIGPPERRPE